jgi:hypothetical protein
MAQNKEIGIIGLYGISELGMEALSHPLFRFLIGRHVQTSVFGSYTTGFLLQLFFCHHFVQKSRDYCFPSEV